MMGSTSAGIRMIHHRRRNTARYSSAESSRCPSIQSLSLVLLDADGPRVPIEADGKDVPHPVATCDACATQKARVLVLNVVAEERIGISADGSADTHATKNRVVRS